MKHKALAIMFVSLALFHGPSAFGQFLPQEIAGRDGIEHFLLTAEILRTEPIGEGVTKPTKVYLGKDGIEGKAVWKNPSGLQLGFWEGWQYEIAAYRIDKLIGLNMIPPTVERTLNGKEGSLQYWVESKYSLLDLQERGIPIPASAMESTDRMKYLTRAFDSLIANEDRTQQNVRYTEDWRMILIDHSRSFRSSREFTEKLLFGPRGVRKNAEGRPFLYRRLPRAFVDSLKAMTFENVKGGVGTCLTDEEIRSLLARRDLLLEDVAEMIKAQGEDKVLY
jgi:hypothetical protein